MSKIEGRYNTSTHHSLNPWFYDTNNFYYFEVDMAEVHQMAEIVINMYIYIYIYISCLSEKTTPFSQKYFDMMSSTVLYIY